MASSTSYNPYNGTDANGNTWINGVLQTGNATGMIQGSSYNPQSTYNPQGAETYNPQQAIGIPTTGSSSGSGTTTTLASNQQDPYSSYYNANQQSALDTSAFKNQQDQQALQDSINAYNQSNAVNDAQRQSDLLYANTQADTQKNRVNENLATGTKNATEDYNYNKDQLDRANTQNQGNIQSSYAVRGLGNSSDVQTAQAQRQIDYQNAWNQANAIFNRNISGLNTNAQRQLSDINSYLNNLRQKYDYQTQNIDISRYQQDADYRRQADALLFNKDQIDKQQSALHSYVTASNAAINTTPTAYTTESTSPSLEVYNANASTLYPTIGTASNPSNLSGSYISSTNNGTNNKNLQVTSAPTSYSLAVQ